MKWSEVKWSEFLIIIYYLWSDPALRAHLWEFKSDFKFFKASADAFIELRCQSIYIYIYISVCPLFILFLPDPRGAGLHEAFQISSVRPYVRTSPHYISVLSYTPNLPWTPNIFTDSGTPMYWLLGGQIPSSPDPPNPPYGGAQKYVFFGGVISDGTFWPLKSKLFLWSFWRPWGVT